jgi:anthranilate 1,2-dioxygenase large subunit
MYHENLKDPYHATLLHSFLVVFGLLVAGNKSTMFVDKDLGRHGYMGSAKTKDKYASVSAETKAEMRSFHEGFRLRDERFLDYVSEFDSPWSVTMMTVWPNLIVQREMNTLGVRHIIPNGPNSMIMQWTMFGYEEDSPEMESHRLRQGNLMGPSGFLGLEDNEALKFVQEGLRRSSTDINTIKLDSNHLGTSESLISEAAIRSLYVYYRDVMGVEVEGASE